MQKPLTTLTSLPSAARGRLHIVEAPASRDRHRADGLH
jgi:hypothetical protein